PPPSEIRKGLRVMSMTRLLVDSSHDLEGGERIAQPRPGWAALANRPHDRCHFDGPRVVGHRILPHGRLRRPHCRQHAVPRQLLGAVAATETLDLELAVLAVDLHRERVLPLRGAGVKPRDLALRGLEM